MNGLILGSRFSVLRSSFLSGQNGTSPCSKKRSSVPSGMMEGPADKPLDGTVHWNWSIGLLGLLLLLAWQTWLALGLFGPEAPWQTLLDERPVISGAHPQH